MEKGEPELDMENRDPHDLNEHIKIRFDEVFGEPDGVRSIDCVWRCAFACFNCSLSCCYNVLSVLCALPLAFCWGISFAQQACYHIWCCTPYLKQYLIQMTMIRKFLEACLGAFIGPCCTTCGLCFSKIEVKNTT